MPQLKNQLGPDSRRAWLLQLIIAGLGLPLAADRRTGRDAAANVAIFHFLEKLERRSFELQYFKAHILHSTLFERSEFLIDTGTSPQKNPSVCVCSTNLGFSVTSANGIRPNHGIPLPAYIHSF